MSVPFDNTSVPFDNMSDHQRVHLIMAFHDNDEDDDSDLTGPTGLSHHESSPRTHH